MSANLNLIKNACQSHHRKQNVDADIPTITGSDRTVEPQKDTDRDDVDAEEKRKGCPRAKGSTDREIHFPHLVCLLLRYDFQLLRENRKY